MGIKDEVVSSGKKWIAGVRGLAHLELKDALDELAKQTLFKTLLLLSVLLAAAWLSVAIALQISASMGWRSAATIMTGITLALSVLLYYWPQIAATKEQKLKAAEAPKIIETKDEFRAMIQQASQDLSRIPTEAIEEAKVRYNPLIVAETTINKNPLVFFFGTLAVGLAVGMTQTKRNLHKETTDEQSDSNGYQGLHRKREVTSRHAH